MKKKKCRWLGLYKIMDDVFGFGIVIGISTKLDGGGMIIVISKYILCIGPHFKPEEVQNDRTET